MCPRIRFVYIMYNVVLILVHSDCFNKVFYKHELYVLELCIILRLHLKEKQMTNTHSICITVVLKIKVEFTQKTVNNYELCPYAVWRSRADGFCND